MLTTHHCRGVYHNTLRRKYTHPPRLLQYLKQTLSQIFHNARTAGAKFANHAVQKETSPCTKLTLNSCGTENGVPLYRTMQLRCFTFSHLSRFLCLRFAGGGVWRAEWACKEFVDEKFIFSRKSGLCDEFRSSHLFFTDLWLIFAVGNFIRKPSGCLNLQFATPSRQNKSRRTDSNSSQAFSGVPDSHYINPETASESRSCFNAVS